MTRTIGVADLQEHTSEILREVQEGSVFNVSVEGAVIARLVPMPQNRLTDEQIQELLDDLDRRAAEIGAAWPAGLSVQEVIDDIRS